MSQRCCVCSFNTIFYLWSSSRNFPKNKLLRKLKPEKILMKELFIGKPICLWCYEEIKNEEI